MKIKKPTVSEQQSALEEYVDFLLTDHSNVTPIDVNKKRNEKTVTKSQLKSVTEPKIEELNTQPLGKHLKAKTENKVEKKVEKVEKKISNESLDLASSTSEVDASIEMTSPHIIDNKKIQPDESELTKEQQVTNPKTNTHPFVLESEEDELKKWDALLTREKEQELTHPQNLEEKRSDAVNSQSNDSHNHNQTQTRSEIVSDTQSILPHKEVDHRLLEVEKLLSRISLATKPLHQTDVLLKDESEEKIATFTTPKIETEISEETARATFFERQAVKTRDMLPEVFQTLIFHVGKLPLAVPLLKLGGIVHMNEEVDITPLVGTPDWFMGLVPSERGNLMVIDTHQYLMPEQKDIDKHSYEYLILLDDTNWALACHTVGDAKNLTSDDIRWAEKSSKRPWFGGMVVDYMSALIEVDALINMLSDSIVE